MDDLKVPYGLNKSGDLVSVESAVKDRSYFCPCCGVSLILREGNFRKKHFSHPSISDCSFESVLHKIAKLLVKDAINNNAINGKHINIKNSCNNCGKSLCSVLPPNTFSFAKEEVQVSDFICDVAGYRFDELSLAVEILNTHKVDANKGGGLPIYWVELKAEDVIKDSYSWIPVQSKLKAVFCSDCKSYMRNVVSIADKWGVDRSLYTPVKRVGSINYIAGTEVCFKCKEEIPVFWWKGVPFCEEEPPKPRPKTIKYRYSKQYGGHYWANTCASCNMIQGDNYIFLFDGGALKGLPLNDKADYLKVMSGKSVVNEFMKRMVGKF